MTCPNFQAGPASKVSHNHFLLRASSLHACSEGRTSTCLAHTNGLLEIGENVSHLCSRLTAAGVADPALAAEALRAVLLVPAQRAVLARVVPRRAVVGVVVCNDVQDLRTKDPGQIWFSRDHF